MPLFEKDSRNTETVSPEGNNAWADFASGFGDRVKAPLHGIKQIASGSAPSLLPIKEAQANESKPESQPNKQNELTLHPASATNHGEHQNNSTARLVGEMVGATTLFVATTALLRHVPGPAGFKALAPVSAGAALGFLEPVLPGQSSAARLARTAEGAFSIAALEQGPKLLTRGGILQSEKAIGGALLSGGLVGAVSEQTRSLVQTGHFSDLERTGIAAATFGITNGIFHGSGLALGRGARAVGEHSRHQDQLSLKAVDLVENKTLSEAANGEPWHLILGSGGSKAALTGTGVVVACREAGLKIATIGGVSGGTMPAAFAASEMPSHKMLQVATEMDIQGLVSKKPWLRQLFSERSGTEALRNGIYDTRKLGEVANQHVPVWPERFWTMAVGGQSEVVISKAGIFEYSSREQQAIISNRPVSVGDAVRASSAIPGVFEAIAINGRMLFDGALGKFGKCPTDIAVKHLGVPKDHIIASLPAGAMTTTNKALYYIAKFLSGSFDKNQSKIVEEAGVVIRPRVDSFGSLKLNIDKAQREEAIMAGYRSAVEEFARSRIVTGPKLEELREAGRSFQTLQEAVKPGRFYPPMVINPGISIL